MAQRSQNAFTGFYPATFRKLSKLQVLMLHHNRLRLEQTNSTPEDLFDGAIAKSLRVLKIFDNPATVRMDQLKDPRVAEKDKDDIKQISKVGFRFCTTTIAASKHMIVHNS